MPLDTPSHTHHRYPTPTPFRYPDLSTHAPVEPGDGVDNDNWDWGLFPNPAGDGVDNHGGGGKGVHGLYAQSGKGQGEKGDGGEGQGGKGQGGKGQGGKGQGGKGGYGGETVPNAGADDTEQNPENENTTATPTSIDCTTPTVVSTIYPSWFKDLSVRIVARQTQAPKY
ncbi:hypothetical protein K505DRAFT_358731 [Melanomma pulvis-pyrius CBS 109.77]|uniref:Uncharacterized protein n=1 Tax=Melanomma pulvis-pyrius CBS 109.77 TaxID=1314802 RepID=A0A6A6XKS2_9PLEO|nr:hypothetical protein K505DRAFT_358731 [Melanomma pulvis-pyrius CBS 109.77]